MPFPWYSEKPDLISTHLLHGVRVFDGHIVTVQMRRQTCVCIFKVDGCPFLNVCQGPRAFTLNFGVWASDTNAGSKGDKESE